MSSSGIRFASGARLLDAFGNEPPLMSYLGSELESIDPDAAGDRAPLPEALGEAIVRVLFLMDMKQDDPLDNGPDITPPMPNSA